MTDLTPELKKLFDKHQRDFFIQNEDVGKHVYGERGLKRLQDQYYLLYHHVLETYDTIEQEQADELLANIRDKLSVNAQVATPSEFWWSPPDHVMAEFLQAIKRTLEKEVKPKSDMWRRFGHFAWLTAVNLIYLLFVLGAFSIAHTPFENVTIGILVLIYNTVVRTWRATAMVGKVALVQDHYTLGQIARRLRLKYTERNVVELDRLNKRAYVDVLVEACFLGLGALIALWHFATAILG